MGFDINRFRESDIKEEFICPICHDILQEPILLQTCEHVFCSQCINEWLQKCKQKSCPIDREEICENSLRPPQRSFKNLISNLLISCDFLSNGCQQWIKIDELSVHTNACVYNPVIMSQKIECPANCGAIITRCESRDEHNCVIFLKKIIDSNKDSIEELVNENKRLSKESNTLNTKYNHLKDEYEEAMNQLKHFCIENKKFSTDLTNTKQELAINNENLIQLNKTNDKKDMTIDALKTEIQNLKKNNQTMLQMLKSRDNESKHNGNHCPESLPLISFDNDLREPERSPSSDTLIKTSVDNKQLIEALSKRHGLSNRRVISAMLSIDRGVFAPSAASYVLHHIRSIGYGAHTGPATYEAALLQFLEPHLMPNCKVLDIGSGTGFLTACINCGPKEC
ncbi:unnamed protein product [Medioppia subpectinata]|uniref:RING-type domain-containing protein n=1 Tax=Medioppia subpectinata TaxID=1979941 RepID=A0A7R9KWP7_9ACAR|nr:unnamed protein product [Medioppia subpectinata]CAG2111244.1 unnamed protein product [Medioppia subpectinata]